MGVYGLNEVRGVITSITWSHGRSHVHSLFIPCSHLLYMCSGVGQGAQHCAGRCGPGAGGEATEGHSFHEGRRPGERAHCLVHTFAAPPRPCPPRTYFTLLPFPPSSSQATGKDLLPTHLLPGAGPSGSGAAEAAAVNGLRYVSVKQ